MKNRGRKLSKEQIVVIADELKGITLKELDYSIAMNKGSFGLAIEEKAYGILANSDSAPDFKSAGIELKVTPYKENKNGTLSSKERLVLNIINYETENLEIFEKSSLWRKNETLLILFYLYKEELDKGDFMITNNLLHTLSGKDLEIIKDDWKIIVNKIKMGLAHEISEADTMYLGACTKGVNRNSVRKQPFSDILAKQRAYSLKTTYMTQLVRKHINKEKNEEIFKDIKEVSFEDNMKHRLNKYFGKTQSQLMKLFDVKTGAKHINEILLSKMLGLKGKVSRSDEFLKANIQPKTIRVEENGRIIESMSFPAFEYTEIVKQEWENSDLREMFETTKYLLIIFKKIDNEYVFDDTRLWNIPIEILDRQVKDVWEETVNLIKNGDIIESIKNGKKFTTFPGCKFNRVAHVRSHAKNAADKIDLPVVDRKFALKNHTKHGFWLNNTYIKEVISSMN
mgnify:CR=1 FL=1